MKKVIRLTERDLTRIVRRVIKEQYHENIETPSDDDLRSKLDSYKRKMENFLRELKSSGTEIDKHRFLKQVQKETDQMYWDVYDNSDSEPEGFVELQMDLIKHFRQKLNESYRSRIVKRVIKEQYHEKPLIFESTGLGWCSRKYPGKTEEYKKCIETDKVWVNSEYHLVPTDSKTLGEASRIIGELLKAFKGKGTDDTAARKAIYSINSKELYYAVLWKLQHSPTVKSTMGYNYNLVGDFLSTDMSYAQHAGAFQVASGSSKQYLDYERHLKQFNKDEKIKEDKRFFGWK